jgi:peptide-methionine (S)-S-oxide reductase
MKKVGILLMFVINVLIMSSQESSKSVVAETTTFGGGCFWCIEAVFESLNGVERVVSGYSGGWKENPTYKEVCSGSTGHAEVVQVEFNPLIITYSDILEVFFAAHDPTTINRQGADIGTQYRSVIFFHTPRQKDQALAMLWKLNNSGLYKQRLVTEIKPFTTFYKAEASHQDYYSNNPSQPYCRIIINPKLEKVKKKFSGKMRSIN